ncbi:MAG: serine protease [Gammaproteobacteria bacterium]|nr:serine protease [Gammaproteobacteria bacterium]
MLEKTTVSLVLGSGGARGLAHIGIIQWLEEHGFQIESISGSSMGALVGGIYAAGELDAYTHWVDALEQIDVLRLVDFSFQRSGLLKGDKVIETLRELVGDRDIESLPISFTAVATNIDDQKEVWLNEGSLFDAIRASIAIPTVFTPVSFRGATLVDGGLINPIPIAPTLRDKTDITIAVDVGARSEPVLKLTKKPPETALKEPGYRKRISQFVDSVQQRLGGSEKDEKGVFELVSSSMEVMQGSIARFQLAAYTPDVVIEVPRDCCTFYEFYRAREIIELGRQQAGLYMADYV